MSTVRMQKATYTLTFQKPWYVKQMADLLGISAGPKHEIQKFAAEKSLSSLRYLLIEK